MARDQIVDKIAELFQRKGASQYGGEAVTQLEHALQAAMQAEASGASAPLIAAALLHDVGHLLHDLPDDAPEGGVDDVHERLGYNFLRRSFGPEVAEPVRMHVDAKRYLCAVEPAYIAALSPPSLQSLQLQGGPFADGEVNEFESNPYYQQSVALRRWDDRAKIADLTTPPLEHFLQFVAAAVSNSAPANRRESVQP